VRELLTDTPPYQKRFTYEFQDKREKECAGSHMLQAVVGDMLD
jgi:hypothetical protein